MQSEMLSGVVAAVSLSANHDFSKPVVERITPRGQADHRLGHCQGAIWLAGRPAAL